MLMTINRCIDYTKVSNGLGLVPRYETIDLAEAINFPLQCMRNIQHRIQIMLNPIPREICSHIITDKQWLQENILCLVSNAVKYSSEGTVTIILSIQNKARKEKSNSTNSSRKSKQYSYANQRIACVMDNSYSITQSRNSCTPHLVVEVVDHGIGISEDEMSLLFSPFKQTQRLAGGTGLGLYSLGKRVEALKGEFGVAKRNDGKKGSVFWFSIPYKPDETQANQTIPFKKSEAFPIKESSNFLISSSPKSYRTKYAIIIVDDAPSIIKMTTRALEKLGHFVQSAENGEVALRMIEKRWKEQHSTFDIVLMDLQMPVMDGLEATRRIRQLQEAPSESLPYQKIIGFSANSDDETTEEAFKAGIDMFMAKPFKLNTFQETLHNLGLIDV